VGPPSWDGRSSGWLDGLDHYRLGLWDPGVEEGYVEDGGFGYYDMGFEALFADEEQWTNQMLGGSIEGQQLVYADFDTEEQWVDTEFHAWELGGDSMELEIPIHQPTGGTMSSATSSALTIETSSPSTDESPAIQNAEGPSSSDAPLASALNDTPSAEEWHCDFPSCDRSFTHNHRLKYVHFIPNIPFLAN
jgi:hypothetical protein